jgi:MoaA/NifB/PqqE/SkfB family radical SAM enzyme
MTSIREAIRQLFASAQPLPRGTFHYQAPPDSPYPYRLHLRIEPDGSGVLIVNASTVVHLNQTAAEYAYHLITGTPRHQVGRKVAARYHITPEQAQKDFQDLVERLETMIHTPDLDPVAYLDFERRDPYSTKLSAPYRLDCALTYRQPDVSGTDVLPTDRVRREMLNSEWYTVMDKAWEAGIPHIVFTGGEPTLRPDLPDLIAHAEKTGQVTGLISNGLRLAETDYLHQLLNSGLDHLMLVLDLQEEQAWAALRDVLVEDLFTTVHLTLTDENSTGLNALIDRLAGMGVEAISLSANDPALADGLRAAREYAAQKQLSLVWDLPVPYSAINPVSLETSQEVPNGAGVAWLYVEPDGDVLPAQGINEVLGNLLSDPWDQIWEKALARQSKGS